LEKYLSNEKFRNALNAIVDSLKPKDSKDPNWSKIATNTPEKKIIWKLEHDWHDVFWDRRTPDPIKTEQQMLSLFRRHFLNVWRLNNKEDDDTSKALTPPVNGFSFTPFSVYEKVLNEIGLKKALIPIINLFEAIAHCGKDITDTKPSWPEKESWSPLDGKWIPLDANEKQETYASRVRFFAVSKCFSEPIKDVCLFVVSEDKTDDNKYMEWMRIIWNILENTQVDSEKSYQSGLNLIDELGNYWHEILSWLSKDESKIDSALAKEQILEEREKAKKMQEFHDTIKNVESIFKGTIRFLYRDETGTPNWGTFNLKSQNAVKYFTYVGLKSDKAVEFITAFIKQFPYWIHDDCYIYKQDLASWKLLLLDDKFKVSWHNIFMTKELSSLPCEELNGYDGQQMRVKTQLLTDGVVDYFVTNYGNARFKWLDDRFRLYAPHQRRYEHILFDTGNYRRNEMLVRCLRDFNLKTSNTRIGNSNLFVGEDISIKVDSLGEHPWTNRLWEMHWWNGNNTSSGCLVFDHQEKGIKYAVDVHPKATDDGNQYSVVLFRREGKTEGDIWIEKARDSVLLEQYGMSLGEDMRYWVKNLSVDKTLSCISTIINQPFS
jgi:hypothetical protein